MKIFALCENGKPLPDAGLCQEHYLEEDKRTAVEEEVGFDHPGLVLWEQVTDTETPCRTCGAKGTE